MNHEDQLDQLKAEIEAAIWRSVTFTESVQLYWDGAAYDKADVMRIIGQLSDTYDYVDETPTMVDVWGEVDTEEFRIKIYKA